MYSSKLLQVKLSHCFKSSNILEKETDPTDY